MKHLITLLVMIFTIAFVNAQTVDSAGRIIDSNYHKTKNYVAVPTIVGNKLGTTKILVAPEKIGQYKAGVFLQMAGRHAANAAIFSTVGSGFAIIGALSKDRELAKYGYLVGGTCAVVGLGYGISSIYYTYQAGKELTLFAAPTTAGMVLSF